ncbi:GNAT family N-acetyltransferase [Archangium violaceum]|uniref:GNAT family N-acetyltransferase n=1 Tax=Archangium violaceum TaxID=83451 RepID=UPI002B2DB6A0|nr:GNAT family N-acetyltransferase [Archangium gephyra]WPB82348.1 GNAT family N-acetyltransferase [Archangium gephyra]
MIAPGPTLETPRLLLRPTAKEDLEGFATLIGDPESARYIGGLQPRTMAWRAMNAMAGSWVLNGYSMFSVLEKATGRWVGRVGPWVPEGWPGTEVGWGILREFWGRGYATEASAAAMDWAFEHLGWTRIIHCIDPDNEASKQVALRLGSRLLGPGKLPPPYGDSPVELWGQDRDDWRARRKGAP